VILQLEQSKDVDLSLPVMKSWQLVASKESANASSTWREPTARLFGLTTKTFVFYGIELIV
jgi:hypothetical protein